MIALREMDENDLKDLGIDHTISRKRIMDAAAPRVNKHVTFVKAIVFLGRKLYKQLLDFYNLIEILFLDYLSFVRYPINLTCLTCFQLLFYFTLFSFFS